MAQSTYHLAATAFGRAGLWRQGISLAAMAEEEGAVLSPSTLTSVLGACAKGARWEEALNLLRKARPVLREAFLLSDRDGDRDGDWDEEQLQNRSPNPVTAAGGADGEKGAVGTGKGAESPPQESREGGEGKGTERRRIRGEGAGRRREEDVVSAYTLAMVACRSAGRHAEGLEVLSMLEEDGGGRRREDESFFRVALKCCAKAPATGGGRRSRAGEGEGWEGSDGGGGGATAADGVLESMSAQGIPCRVEGFTDVAQVGVFSTRQGVCVDGTGRRTLGSRVRVFVLLFRALLWVCAPCLLKNGRAGIFFLGDVVGCLRGVCTR